MSFIATANPPASTAEADITNDPWFPALATARVREICRLDGTVTAHRLRHALAAALLTVNGELAAYKSAQQALGYGTLGAVPAPELDGKSAQLSRYERAVCAALQADLAEAYRSMDTMPAGAGKEARVQEGLNVKIDEHRRNLRWAISDILGIGRSTVELI